MKGTFYHRRWLQQLFLTRLQIYLFDSKGYPVVSYLIFIDDDSQTTALRYFDRSIFHNHRRGHDIINILPGLHFRGGYDVGGCRVEMRLGRCPGRRFQTPAMKAWNAFALAHVCNLL
jgi:hypothetical protein